MTGHVYKCVTVRSLIALYFWWFSLLRCLRPFPWKFSYCTLQLASFKLATLAACVLPILNCSAISLQLIFLFLTTSSILIFSSKFKHLLFNFQTSLFLLLIYAMLFPKWFFSNFSVIFQMIKFEQGCYIRRTDFS